ncbi:MAG: endolytic transglycosylase MltG [Hyphomicrobium sp.]
MNRPYHQKGSNQPRSPAEILEPKKAPQSPKNNDDFDSDNIVQHAIAIGSFTLSLILAFMIFVGITYKLLNDGFNAPGPLNAKHTVVVDKGSGRFDIARKLEREGIISNYWIFILNDIFQNSNNLGKHLDFKAGDYEFNQAVSMREVWDTITLGKTAVYKITLPEGLTSQQIVDRLNNEVLLSGDIRKTPEEGSLMPDTYLISRGMPRQDLIARMQVEQTKFVETAWNNRQPDLPIGTVREAITLASIVEKETGLQDERERVASVFVNRLKKKMRLQSDPTIIYGIVGGAGTLGRSLTHNDVETKTNYNTYQINGLPPGPICNPGRSAILATLHPAKTTDLYFVADGTGGHTFSNTLNEHNSAVQVWRNLSKQNDNENSNEANAQDLAKREQIDNDEKISKGAPKSAAPKMNTLSKNSINQNKTSN